MRIGHAKLTDVQLMEKQPPPRCNIMQHSNTTVNPPHHPRMHSLKKPETLPETNRGRQPRGYTEHNKLPQRSGSIPPHLNHKFEHNYTKIKAKKSRLHSKKVKNLVEVHRNE
uniref:Uncharacterized protein n=1 Tax=Cacopsylla melanoneura TaxID=428564 RepID=A0A8D8Y8Z9_9HEMI